MRQRCSRPTLGTLGSGPLPGSGPPLTSEFDALALLNAERYGDRTVTRAVLNDCEPQAVILALVEHFFAIDDAYLQGTSEEAVLDDYLNRAAANAIRAPSL